MFEFSFGWRRLVDLNRSYNDPTAVEKLESVPAGAALA